MDLPIKKPPTLWGTGGRKPPDSGDLLEKTSWLISRRKNQKMGENQEVERIEKSNYEAEQSGIT